MKKLLLAAASAAALSTPAVARDGSAYFGVEGGILFPRDSKVDVSAAVDDEPLGTLDNAVAVDFKTGYDLDVIAGYDLGPVRLEAELAHKRAKGKDLELDPALLDAIEDELGETISEDDLDIGGKVKVTSLMGNALLDFGNDQSVSGYVGGGFGRARVKAFGETDKAWAWQAIAGVRTALSENIDVGLKYRYFRTQRLNYGASVTLTDDAGAPVDIDLGARTRFSSHSLLASLIYNFGARRAEPAPEPVTAPVEGPPPPQTQTCPDGSVVLASEACPAAPPPPPPPPPSPERG